MNKVIEMFDLFKLHDDEQDVASRGWVRLGGSLMLDEVRKIIINIISRGYSLQGISKIIGNKLNVSPITVSKQLREIKNKKWYGKRQYIPIPILSKLIRIYNQEHFEEEKWRLIKLVEWASSGTPRSKRTKVIKSLTPELATIAGIHAADGTLARFKTHENSYAYLWAVVDSDRGSLEYLKECIKKIFNIDTKIKKSKYDNSFYIRINNKVIFRYLNKILKFKIGYKTDTVSIPRIIKNSKLEMRRYFALGVLTFDGCVDVSGYVRLEVKSRKLRDDVANIIKNDGINVMVGDNNQNEYSLRVNILKESERILKYFIKNSIKYLQAKFFVTNSSSKEIIELFKGNKNNKVNLRKVLDVSKKLKKFDIKTLKNHLNVSERTLRSYLRILIKSGFIKSEVVSHKILYIYIV